MLVSGPGQGFTEEECQREMKIIEGLFEKMMACEKNMEKLFAASLEALDRAEGLNKRELWAPFQATKDMDIQKDDIRSKPLEIENIKV